jgi:hypothetical protein
MVLKVDFLEQFWNFLNYAVLIKFSKSSHGILIKFQVNLPKFSKCSPTCSQEQKQGTTCGTSQHHFSAIISNAFIYIKA